MTEKRNWAEARDWNSAAHQAGVQEAQQLEALMRSILKLFADGCLVYRKRETLGLPVSTKSDRLKRLRANQIGTNGQPVVA